MLVLLVATLAALVWMAHFIRETVPLSEIGWTFVLGAITAIRVLVLIALASLIWVPIGVWIGLRPRIADRAQPIVQFLAAFPANLFFPAAVVLILTFKLNPQIWLSPLMILGTQWYILFNVIGGTISLPAELRLAASNLGVRRWLWWRRVMLPAIFPAYVTGAVTAAGGSWNASIVVRGRAMGRYDVDRDRARRLYRRMDRQGRRGAHHPGDRRAVPLCARLQPPAVAPALQPRRRAAAAGLMMAITCGKVRR